MEKLLKLLREQQNMMAPRDELSQIISDTLAGIEEEEGLLEMEDLELVQAAGPVAPFKPVDLDKLEGKQTK